jgi:methionyl-tRNA formyltransferase
MRLVVLSDLLFLNRLRHVAQSLSIQVDFLLVKNLIQLQEIPARVKKESRLISIFSTEIVPLEQLQAFGLGCYNLHPGTSRYPGWRAWSFAIMNNEDHFGLTLHDMTPKVDEGLIIKEQRFPRELKSTEQDFFQQVGDFVEFFFISFSEFFLYEELQPKTPINWMGVKFKKRDVQELIQINEDIEIEVLISLIRAFGFGFQGEKPYVMRSGKRYILGPTSKTPRVVDDVLNLYGFSFWSEVLLHH